MDSSLSNKAGFEKIVLSNSINLNKNSRFSTNLLIQDSSTEKERLDYMVNSSLLAALFGFNNSTNFSRDVDNDISIQNRSTYRYNNWRFSAAAIYDSLLYGMLSTTFRNPYYSVQTSLHKGEKLDIYGTYNINLIWTTMVNFNWDFQDKECQKIMFGLFYNYQKQIGAQISFRKNNSYQYYGIAGILEINLFKNEILNLSPEFWWKDNGDIESYLLDIRQLGKTFSPGILIIHDNSKLIRCEGYLSWKF